MPLIRSSGLTEAVGDLVWGCTGGRPTPSGQQVQPVNLQMYLPASVTSRLLGDSGESVGVNRYGASADEKTLYREFGITAEAVAAAARASIAKART